MINNDHSLASELASLGARTIFVEQEINGETKLVVIDADSWDEYCNNLAEIGSFEEIENEFNAKIFDPTVISIDMIQEALEDDFIDINDVDRKDLSKFRNDLDALTSPDSSESSAPSNSNPPHMA